MFDMNTRSDPLGCSLSLAAKPRSLSPYECSGKDRAFVSHAEGPCVLMSLPVEGRTVLGHQVDPSVFRFCLNMGSASCARVARAGSVLWEGGRIGLRWVC